MNADHATELHAEDAILAVSLDTVGRTMEGCTSRRIQGAPRFTRSVLYKPLLDCRPCLI